MSIIAFGPFRLDLEAGMLFRDNEPVPLGQRATALLSALVERPGALISKDALVDAAWQGLAVEDSNLSVQIATLRRVLGEAGGADWIETMPRRGYRFVGPVVRSQKTNGSSVATSGQQALTQRSGEPILSPSGDPSLVVGRTAPLEMLEGMKQRILAGQRQVAFVTGEAGIGKTAFIAKATELLTGQGFDLLYGRCTERFGNNEVFLPLIDALVTRYRANGLDLLPIIRTHAPTWMLQLPGVIDAPEHAAFQEQMFGATRERMLREFCDLVEALSTDRLWVLVLEDLHWSDFATLDVLSRFARGTGRASSWFSAPIGHRTAPSADIRSGACIRIWRSTDAATSCASIDCPMPRSRVIWRCGSATANWPRRLSGPVYERTLGHPLFVTSMLKHLIDQQAIVEVDGMWRLSSQARPQEGVPNNLLNMITHELDRLNEEERHLLNVASVAGEEFSAALVAAGLSRDAIEVERDIEALVRKDHILVRSGASEWPDGTYSGSYAFRHILYQNVIYQDIAPGLRAQTHKRLGKRLEEAYARPHLGDCIRARAAFRAGSRFPKRVALPQAGRGKLEQTPRPRGSRELPHARARHTRSFRCGRSICNPHRPVAATKLGSSLVWRSRGLDAGSRGHDRLCRTGERDQATAQWPDGREYVLLACRPSRLPCRRPKT